MGEPVRAARLWGIEEALRDGEIASAAFLMGAIIKMKPKVKQYGSTSQSLFLSPLRNAALAALFLPNMPSIKHVSYERSIDDVYNHLGEKAFAVAWDEGRAMTPTQALEAQKTMSIS